MRNENERLKPTGTTMIERWYALARKHMAIIAKRERTRERCKHCFDMWFNPHAAKYELRHGCGGCAEMETFMEKCRAFFAGGGRGSGKRTCKGTGKGARMGKGARNDR